MLIFQYDKKPVRVAIDVNGEPWFVARDICNILGSKNASAATLPLDGCEKKYEIVKTNGGWQKMCVVNTCGLHSLVFRSNKPNAKDVRLWITSKLLPYLRNFSGVTIATEEEEVEELYLQAMAALRDALQRKNKKNSRNKLLRWWESGRRFVINFYHTVMG